MTTTLDTSPDASAEPARSTPTLSRRILRRLRELRPDSTRKRVWALTLTAMVAVASLFVVTFLAIGQAREGMRVIGHGAGPQVVATADLYYALSDMDAQVVNVLLMGNEHHLGDGREAALALYEERRGEANRALLQAAQLVGDDSTELQNVHDILNGLGRYEQLVAEAMLLSEQHDHPAGPPPDDVVEMHREATDLMRLELLPKAYNLTLDRGSLVRVTYEEKHSAVVAGAVGTLVTGALSVVALLWLQFYLRGRFRRRVNPALAVATLGVVVLAASGAGFLYSEAQHLRAAKEDGFDSVLTLAQARATGISMHSGQSRYILAPEYAESYQQVYLENAQAIFYLPVGNLEDYYAAVDESVESYPDVSGDDPMRGFLGDQARELAQELPPEVIEGGAEHAEYEAIQEVLLAYQGFQQSDQSMRTQADRGLTQSAIDFALGSEGGTSRNYFQRYDAALVSLNEIYQESFEDAIADGERFLPAWSVLLPVSALAIAGLLFAGVRPRLAEYR